MYASPDWGMLQMGVGVMTNILDHIQPGLILDVDDLPRSASRQELFAITRRIVQATIADMDLDPDSLSQVEEAFISAGLL